jgi:hypothetical protein
MTGTSGEGAALDVCWLGGGAGAGGKMKSRMQGTERKQTHDTSEYSFILQCTAVSGLQ